MDEEGAGGRKEIAGMSLNCVGRLAGVCAGAHIVSKKYIIRYEPCGIFMRVLWDKHGATMHLVKIVDMKGITVSRACMARLDLRKWHILSVGFSPL